PRRDRAVERVGGRVDDPPLVLAEVSPVPLRGGRAEPQVRQEGGLLLPDGDLVEPQVVARRADSRVALQRQLDGLAEGDHPRRRSLLLRLRLLRAGRQHREGEEAGNQREPGEPRPRASTGGPACKYSVLHRCALLYGWAWERGVSAIGSLQGARRLLRLDVAADYS